MAVREAGRGVEIKSREVRLETPEQPLHSPKLTQRRAHPAVVYSTPAGERERPRVRRGHVENTRGGDLPIPTVVSNHETAFQSLNRSPLRSGRGSVCHPFVIVTLTTLWFANQLMKPDFARWSMSKFRAITGAAELFSVVSPKFLHGSRRPGTPLAAFSSVDIRPGIPPSSALRVDAARRLATTGTHLNDANRKGT